MKLTVLQGVSGSGKTTKAAELSRQTGAVVVSFDELRERKPHFPPEQIMMGLLWCAGYALSQKKDVIVDACNMHEHDRIRWETVAAVCDAQLEWIKLETPIEECIRRDAKRANPVGAFRIHQQAAGR